MDWNKANSVPKMFLKGIFSYLESFVQCRISQIRFEVRSFDGGIPLSKSRCKNVIVLWGWIVFQQLANKWWCLRQEKFFVSSCWSTRDHLGKSTGISNPAGQCPQVKPRVVKTICSVHTLPAYTAQLLTLHQQRANKQYRTASQI